MLSKFISAILKSTSTTEVFLAFPAVKGLQAILRTLSILPGHASDTLKFYIAKAEYATRVSSSGTTTTTSIYLPVDVAGGHVVNGHTLTTNDFVVVADSAGLKVRAISAVNDDSAKLYCHITVAALVSAPVAGQEIWIVRAADVLSLAGGGTSRVEKLDFVAGNVGAPLVLSSTSNGSNDCTSLATVEYVKNGY